MFGTKNSSHTLFMKLLEQERAIVLSGDLNQLGALLPRKQKILTALLKSISTLNSNQLEQIKSYEKQNASLYEAALAGIKSASNRIKEICEAQQTMTTYGNDGKRAKSTPSGSSFERRA